VAHARHMTEMSIAIQADGFTLHDGMMRRFFGLDDVAEIVIYKRDELTTDLICCDITTQSNGTPRTWFVHEDTSGFEELMRFFETLQGFRSNWRQEVVLPPFAAKRTVVFRREGRIPAS